MKWFYNLNLKGKIAFVIIVGLIATVTTTFMAIRGLSSMNENLNTIVDVDSTKVDLSNKIVANILDIQRNEKNMILVTENDKIEKYKNNVLQAYATLQKNTQSITN